MFRFVRPHLANFTTSSCSKAHTNRPLNLDPSLRALLKDVDISLKNHKAAPPPTRRELDVISSDLELSPEDLEEPDVYEGRKSPAAHFGSRRFGAVVLPLELQNSINLLISESDKVQLHSDATRLFRPDKDEDSWNSQFDDSHHSRLHHGERAGFAFASVALPAHYSAILAVLDHVKHRLNPDWRIKRVFDWGAATGSGLWASLHAFRMSDPKENVTREDLKICDSTIDTYIAVDKRDGLTAIGKRLLRSVDIGNLDVCWQRSFQERNKVKRSQGHDTLALSAFMLSSLKTPSARKTLVKEIWESGAHTIVLLDHGTRGGFEAIVEAREALLQMGQKESDDPEADHWDVKGCHVVAPCPHDAACPLHHPGDIRLVCAFPQRLQRPSFVRLTKHSGQGHEDINYSYVVLRRGKRPDAVKSKVGRIGEVGRRDLEKEALRHEMKELMVHEPSIRNEETNVGTVESISTANEPQSRPEIEEMLRLEAYRWPRLVFPPLKRSGHIILDGCTQEGKIMRMTVPKSQGKQPYYDARKSSWGDIFPHEPKNPPQERYQPLRTRNSSIRGPATRKPLSEKDKRSYEALSLELKETRKKSRRDKVRALEEKEP